MDREATFTDLLLMHCKTQVGFTGRIDYSIYIYQKPLVFGVAVTRGGQSFFFSRVLCSKEMAKLWSQSE